MKFLLRVDMFIKALHDRHIVILHLFLLLFFASCCVITSRYWYLLRFCVDGPHTPSQYPK
jgi:hypothetical protein